MSKDPASVDAHGTLGSMFDPDHLAPERIRRLSRAEYDRMVALGMFEDERVERLACCVITARGHKDLGFIDSENSSWYVADQFRFQSCCYGIRLSSEC